MRSRSPLFMGILCGLAGFIGGAFAGMSAFYFLGRTSAGNAGPWREYAAPFGLVAGLLGLLAGGWGGFHIGSRPGR